MKERHVFRAVALYAALVLALWQAVDYVVSALSLPDVVMRAVVIGALMGLPIVVVLSWLSDLRKSPMSTAGGRRPRSGPLLLAVVGFALLLVAGAGMHSFSADHAATTNQSSPTSTSSLEHGMESFFSGDLRGAAKALVAVAADPSRSAHERQEALRYVARAHVELGETAAALDALRMLVEVEPPMALLLPGVETDTLMTLYYVVRREKLARATAVTVRSKVTAVHVLTFTTSGTAPAGIGRGVAAILLSELFGKVEGVKVVDRSGAEHRFDAYRFLSSPEAARLIPPSHVVVGSAAGAGEQILISAWLLDAVTGLLHTSAQVLVPSTAALLPRIVELAEKLAADMGPQEPAPTPHD
jgi:hypothetical protein